MRGNLAALLMAMSVEGEVIRHRGDWTELLPALGYPELCKVLTFIAAEPVLVILSRKDRVDLQKLGTVVGSPVRLAKATEVKQINGAPVGEVNPFEGRLSLIVDKRLSSFKNVLIPMGDVAVKLNPENFSKLPKILLADVTQQ